MCGGRSDSAAHAGPAEGKAGRRERRERPLEKDVVRAYHGTRDATHLYKLFNLIIELIQWQFYLK